MADKSPCGGARCEIPEAQRSVPGAREGKLTIRGDNNITNEVGVTSQSTLWYAIVGLISGQLPHDDGLVSRRRQDHVRELRCGGDLCYPSIVALKGPAKGHLLGHGCS